LWLGILDIWWMARHDGALVDRYGVFHCCGVVWNTMRALGQLWRSLDLYGVSLIVRADSLSATAALLMLWRLSLWLVFMV
jgi:hypothetical protein